jgi:deoxyribose-phosphate aldolase
MTYNKFIDHTNLHQDAKTEDIIKLCEEAKAFDFMSVCINPWFIPLCKNQLKGSDVKVCTVIGFPLGANTTDTKVFETKDAIAKGADEVDMVINVSAIKDKNYDYVLNEIKAIREASLGKTLKVILETCLLTDEEIVEACKISKQAHADFVKTSTGFSTGGATAHHVKLMRETVGKNMGVKASGGIRSRESMLEMIEAGANRIGTSSGTKIV